MRMSVTGCSRARLLLSLLNGFQSGRHYFLLQVLKNKQALANKNLYLKCVYPLNGIKSPSESESESDSKNKSKREERNTERPVAHSKP